MIAISPWFITGFIDAEGCFMFSVSRNSKVRLGWTMAPRFNITMHIRDLKILVEIQNFFGGIGTIVVKEKFVHYNVNSVKDLAILITHFTYFPLQSHKRYMYYIFVIIYDIYSSGKHLTIDGFLLCISYVNILNKPLKSEIIAEITSTIGSLPMLVIPPIPLTISYVLTPQ